LDLVGIHLSISGAWMRYVFREPDGSCTRTRRLN